MVLLQYATEPDSYLSDVRSGRASASGTVQLFHPLALLAADNGVTLNFDFRLGYGQGGHGDEGAAREIVAEYFPPELGKAIKAR